MSTALVRFFAQGALLRSFSFAQKGYAVPSALCDFVDKKVGSPSDSLAFTAHTAALAPTAVGSPAAEEKTFDIRVDVFETPNKLEIVMCEWTNDEPVFRGCAAQFRKHVEKGFGQC